MTDLVSKALLLAAAKESALPSSQVDRALDSEIDLGNLLTWNENEIDLDKLTSKDDQLREKFLADIARDNAQVIVILSPTSCNVVILSSTSCNVIKLANAVII